MAGYGQVEQKSVANQGYDWVKPANLVAWAQDFCVLAIEQDSFDQNGNPQYTISILYARNGQACEKAFNLTVTPWRMKRVQDMLSHEHPDGHIGLPFHHLKLVRKPNKKQPQYPFMDFADVPGADNLPCTCDGAGIVDMDDPSTWTEHMRLSHTLNTFLVERGGAEAAMDTSSMSEAAIQVMLKTVGAAA